MSCNCDTFTVTGTSYTVTLNKPIPSGEENSLQNDIVLFDFWSDNFDTSFEGINSRPLSLTGYEIMCGDNISGGCFPMCFPLCFAQPLWTKFINIQYMIDNHEPLTITGLGDCIDGTYILSHLKISAVRGTPSVIRWDLSLELKRRI